MPQPGFLDLDNRYAKLDGGGDPLVKIKSNIIMPTELPGNPVAEFDVGLLPVWTVPIWKNVRINSCSAD